MAQPKSAKGEDDPKSAMKSQGSQSSCGTCISGVSKSLGSVFGRAAADVVEDDLESQSPPSLVRMRFLMRWARLQLGLIEMKSSSQSLVHRQRVVLDYVISMVAPWSARLKDEGKEKEVAVHHLGYLVRFLNKEGVAAKVKATNTLSAWQFQAPRGMLDESDEVALRMWHRMVLPTLGALAQLTENGHEKDRSYVPGPECLELAAWAGEFLSANKVRRQSSLFRRTFSTKLARFPSMESFVSCFSSESEHEEPPHGAEHELEHQSDSEEDGAQMFESFLSMRSGTFSGSGLLENLWSLGGLASSSSAPSAWEFKRGETDHGWDEADATQISVRGSNFLKDKNKFPSEASVFEVVHLDLYECEDQKGYPNISAIDNGVVKELRKAGDERFFFVVNFCMPPLQISCVFAAKGGLAGQLPPADGSKSAALLHRFVEEMSDAERSHRFKVIPWVREGPWIVQKAVGRTPAIIGKSLKVSYFHEKSNYFEVSVDIFSSSAAQRILSLLKGAAKALTLEVFFVLEGKDPEELPEHILGGFRVSRGDLSRTRGPV
mmetsp:Transcript_123716/g.395870  ORF Transcript_123716/g.395870 Transcript_123716/m.395870 type:complete len:548 (-) Transcript_123716:285-1928(-)|eukprot:CAMPEP_0203916100 /NCGR_PEP_ID=MMETSP0359-20131031/56796_1 /ASSEMBLY_ACC=CAM_ASM_000338 /TAXON_ID=268821 /ORGANISM="Scrippsiella Hangoei, Strain SHTV-5" /LENGTH=547 /DNA_ID=CAMNT_0050842717 /DNA_START=7 /DNA_END=1650 /DNA_ORIENTATION=-